MEQGAQRRAKEDEVSGVETPDRWLSEYPRPPEDAPSAQSSLPLDGEMDRRLRDLPARFGIRGDDLAKKLHTRRRVGPRRAPLVRSRRPRGCDARPEGRKQLPAGVAGAPGGERVAAEATPIPSHDTLTRRDGCS